VANNRRDINGIILLDKPLGLTSNRALQRVKSLFQAQKAGHTGSLDPLATGLLPLCFGEATKMSSFLLDADKRYEVVVRLGVSTNTGDGEGEILSQRPLGSWSTDDIEQSLAGFRGEIDQIPPMYSAIKVNGQPLYKFARRGEVLDRAPRRVRIFELKLREWAAPDLRLSVHCSKGTYIRTLAHDLGEAL
jgi:tRNA pseudouridine55 synthase